MSSETVDTVYGAIPAQLSCAKLQDLCVESGIQTGPFGSQLHQEDYVEIGTPIITVEHLGENRIFHSNLPQVSDADKDRLSKYVLKSGDIVFSRVGSVDRRALVQPAEDGWLFSGRCLRVRPNSELLDAQWLSYFFGLPAFKNYIRGIAVGATMPSINTKILSDVPIYFPCLATQREAAFTLAQIDDRITLLRETNVTLEAIAQALFKSWFVDFDPVCAKMEGRAPEGMDEATVALFPDSFEETELGAVPRGWRVGSIYEVSKVIYGAPFASKLFKADPLGKPLVRIRDLKDECPGIYTEEVHPKGYLLQPGDIPVGMDGEFRAYIWGGEEAWLNQRVCVFHPISGACAAFVRSSITPLLAEVEASETATTVIHLGKNDIDRFKVIVPTQDVLIAFTALAQPLYDRLVANKQQAQTLSTLRDTLLPRLISGQLLLLN